MRSEITLFNAENYIDIINERFGVNFDY